MDYEKTQQLLAELDAEIHLDGWIATLPSGARLGARFMRAGRSTPKQLRDLLEQVLAGASISRAHTFALELADELDLEPAPVAIAPPEELFGGVELDAEGPTRLFVRETANPSWRVRLGRPVPSSERRSVWHVTLREGLGQPRIWDVQCAGAEEALALARAVGRGEDLEEAAMARGAVEMTNMRDKLLDTQSSRAYYLA